MLQRCHIFSASEMTYSEYFVGWGVTHSLTPHSFPTNLHLQMHDFLVPWYGYVVIISHGLSLCCIVSTCSLSLAMLIVCLLFFDAIIHLPGSVWYSLFVLKMSLNPNQSINTAVCHRCVWLIYSCTQSIHFHGLRGRRPLNGRLRDTCGCTAAGQSLWVRDWVYLLPW